MDPIVRTTGYVTQIHYTCYYEWLCVYVYLRDSLPDGYIECFTLRMSPSITDNLTMQNMQIINRTYHWRNDLLALLRDAHIHGQMVQLTHRFISGSILDVAISTDIEGFANWV